VVFWGLDQHDSPSEPCLGAWDLASCLQNSRHTCSFQPSECGRATESGCEGEIQWGKQELLLEGRAQEAGVEGWLVFFLPGSLLPTGMPGHQS
jgi:hypothetical protein